MNTRQYFLKQCIEEHKELGLKFSELCETLIATFNDNNFYPGVNFKKSSEDGSISLSTLGENFTLKYELARSEGRSLGRLKVELNCPYRKTIVLLHCVYFDSLGNVRIEPSAACEMNSLTDKSFASDFLDKLTSCYLEYTNSRYEISITKS